MAFALSDRPTVLLSSCPPVLLSSCPPVRLSDCPTVRLSDCLPSPPSSHYFLRVTDVVALAAELLTLQSSTGSEGPAVDFVSRWLVSRGWNVTTQEVTKGRANVWASRAGGGVTFSTHLDTVPPYLPPRLEGNRL